MERNCFYTSFKFQKSGEAEATAMKNQTSKLKQEEEDYITSISWPPRSYTCNFCKREFRSAQALGGHMNVHRRDRALLRQYSPPSDGQFTNLTLNLHHNPNPNSDETKKWAHPVDDPFCLKVSEVRKPVEIVKPNLFERGRKGNDGICHYKAEKVIRLDMEISTVLTDSKKEIDLELRLGYS